MTPFAKTVRIGIIVLILVAVATFVFMPPLCTYTWEQANERNAWTSLKTLATAQEYFREHDANKDSRNDYWRADVAGLYTEKDRGEPLRLIELSCAVADDRPVVPAGPRASKSGYWFRAIHFADEAKPDPARFAFCAFPDGSPKNGRYTFILREDRVVYRKDLGKARGIDVWPDDPEKAGWTKLD